MIDNSDQVVEGNHGIQGWVTAAIVILAIISIAGLGLAWHNSTELQQAQQAFSGQMKTAADNSSQQVAALEQKLAQMDTDVKSQLATKASADDLNAVNGSVNNVKTDLEGTKSDLKMARSELGTLIARNHEEIDVLRRMGERDYVEFTLSGKNKPQKVGSITVELRSVDTKKNKFTVALTVDAAPTEKRDRTVDEPVVFYPRGSHQADEFVVNSVPKDKISG